MGIYFLMNPGASAEVRNIQGLFLRISAGLIPKRHATGSAVRPSVKRLNFTLLVICFLLLVIASPLIAGGGKDTDLSRADALIKEKQYDDAILLLSDYIKKNPDGIDNAQKRLRQIVQIRGEYNSVTEELRNTVVKNPDDVEKILALTRRLEELESPRNSQNQEFITQTRGLAQFTYNQNRLELILNEGRTLAGQGNYSGALAAYARGMDIYQEEFFMSGYGELVEDRVRRGLGDINSGIDSFRTIRVSVNTIAAELEQALRQDRPAAQVREIYDRLIPALDQLVLIQGRIYEAGAYFDDLLLRLQETDPDLGDRSFLSFAVRLVMGYAAGNAANTGGTGNVAANTAGNTAPPPVNDGMISAVGGYWDSLMSRLETAAAGIAERSYQAALVHAVNREYAAASAGFETARSYVEFPLALLDKWTLFKEAEHAPMEHIFEQSIFAEKAGDYLSYQSLSLAINNLLAAENLGSRYEIFQREDNANINPEDIHQEEALRLSVSRFLGEIDSLISRTGAESAVIRNYYEALAASASPLQNEVPLYMDSARTVQENLRALMISDEVRPAVVLYTLANGDLERQLSARQEDFKIGNDFIQGIRRETETGPDFIAHYPAEGLNLLVRIEQTIPADIKTGRALLARYGRERQEILALPELSDLHTSARTMTEELVSLCSRAQTLAAAARTQIARAETLRRDGDRLYQEAQNAAARNTFDAARNRLQSATERYNASLAIQESTSLRQEWDTRLVTLGANITRVENEAVIRDVRSMVTTARNTYFAGNFEQAEETLVRAQNRWRITNIDDDVEVTYWLSIVRGALFLRSGRVIPATAPLYAEMSQLLSNAKRNYDEGVRLINANRRPDGIAKFSNARYLTREVKLMFPVNQEAGILELRMDQVTDPTAFNASFERRLSEAIAGTKRNSIESFADLQNLAEINPRYPGIQNALVQAEIDMGRRPRPPDPRSVARSNELTEAAQAIIDGNVRIQFEVALRQINEALTLNPNNSRAMSLKDRVQTELGGGNIVLSSAAEGEYQRAVRELQQGNTLVALAIVQQLLQDTRNRSSTRILELERRIQSIL
jgi:TolA-binding protein